MYPLAILMPTLWRSHKLGDLIDNINEATWELPHKIYFMCPSDDQDTIDLLTERGETFWIDGPDDMGYATRINKMYKLTTEPWIFTGSDDIYFHPDWLTNALRYRAYAVVSPEDGNNRWGTNFLINRTYIEEQSGCMDIPDVVFYPYGHFFCDTELREVATKRGVFINAPHSQVEHRHWSNGWTDKDIVYDLGLSRFDEDQRVYTSREHLWSW